MASVFDPEFEEFMFALAWNNPFNLYAPVSGRTTPGQSAASLAIWSAVPAVAYVAGYAMVGSEAIAGVSYFNVGTALGMSGMAVGWVFGAVTAGAMVYDVHTDPVKKAKLQKFSSPGADIFRTTGFGGMSL